MQKSPNVCRPLADWLGQTVRFQGYLDHWGTADKTGDTVFLMRNIKVVPYKGCKDQIRTLDHIWLYFDKDTQAADKLERFCGYAAVGTVVSYTRSNGTRDFAIDVKPHVSIKTHFELLQTCKTPKLEDIKTKTALLEITLNLLEIEELDFSIYLSYEEVYQLVRNEYEVCRSQVEINDRYQAMQPHRSKPNTKILNFAAAGSKSTKAAKGFATS